MASDPETGVNTQEEQVSSQRGQPPWTQWAVEPSSGNQAAEPRSPRATKGPRGCSRRIRFPSPASSHVPSSILLSFPSSTNLQVPSAKLFSIPSGGKVQLLSWLLQC